MNFNKLIAVMTLAGGVTGVHAATVNTMNISDTIDSNISGANITNDGEVYTGGTPGPDGLGSDGASGAFKFGTISMDSYTGARVWSGDLNGGVINLAGAAPLSFSSGFYFTSIISVPYTTGTIVANTSDFADAASVGTVLSGNNLIITSLPWASTIAGVTFSNLSPDAGTLFVNNLIKTGVNAYAYRLSFNHLITTADDLSGYYVGFNARWALEGTITTVPEASTYGMMLSGLGLVGAMLARRRTIKVRP